MIHDSERREVARRLLKMPYFSLEHVAYAIGYDEEDDDWDEIDVINRLADLIEPVERMCLYYDADTNHCGCYNTQLIDCDALLELAEKLDGLGLSGFSSGWSSGAVNVGYFASRIREALGVDDDGRG